MREKRIRQVIPLVARKNPCSSNQTLHGNTTFKNQTRIMSHTLPTEPISVCWVRALKSMMCMAGEKEEKVVNEEEEKEENEEGEAGEEEETEPNLDYKIENVVATVTLDIKEKIDLNIIARKYADVEYNPERFPGLVMRIEKPKATILVFSTGKMVVTGMRKASEAKTVVDNVIKRIKKAKIEVSNPIITVQNIVASGDLHTSIDLNMAAVVMEYAMYEPEVFPGLIYRMQDPKTVFLIFSTGRIVCTGGKTKEIVAQAVKKLQQEVKEYCVAKAEGEEFDDGTFY